MAVGSAKPSQALPASWQGSVREKLWIPQPQTARCIRAHRSVQGRHRLVVQAKRSPKKKTARK
eukprot:scaffold546175_cov23-Prasinocladus_malaysianus.AAC.1